jgi:hypothetical protein
MGCRVPAFLETRILSRPRSQTSAKSPPIHDLPFNPAKSKIGLLAGGCIAHCFTPGDLASLGLPPFRCGQCLNLIRGDTVVFQITVASPRITRTFQSLPEVGVDGGPPPNPYRTSTQGHFRLTDHSPRRSSGAARRDRRSAPDDGTGQPFSDTPTLKLVGRSGRRELPKR